jgi:hypothetical protein
MNLEAKRLRSPVKRDLLDVCPRQDSNLRSRLRRAVLYPLSYGGLTPRWSAATDPRPR